jgi:hypothetical protein
MAGSSGWRFVVSASSSRAAREHHPARMDDRTREDVTSHRKRYSRGRATPRWGGAVPDLLHVL